MKFTPLELPGLVLIEPRVWDDSRGSFMESYNRRLFYKNGIRCDFVQDNYCVSRKGVLRGMHYQAKPRGQSKLVRVARGRIYDVAADARKGSKTYGRWCGRVLSAEKHDMLFIPEGFAHGYLALEADTHVLYKASDFYSPEREKGIRWDDPFFGIRWPRAAGGYVISEKDRSFAPWGPR